MTPAEALERLVAAVPARRRTRELEAACDVLRALAEPPRVRAAIEGAELALAFALWQRARARYGARMSRRALARELEAVYGWPEARARYVLDRVAKTAISRRPLVVRELRGAVSAPTEVRT